MWRLQYDKLMMRKRTLWWVNLHVLEFNKKFPQPPKRMPFQSTAMWNGKREEEKCWRRYVALRSHARTLRPHINAMQWVKIIECISHKSLKNNTIAASWKMGEGKLCILISILFNFTQFNLISAYIENWRVKAQKTTPRCNAFYSQINKKKEKFPQIKLSGRHIKKKRQQSEKIVVHIF